MKYVRIGNPDVEGALMIDEAGTVKRVYIKNGGGRLKFYDHAPPNKLIGENMLSQSDVDTVTNNSYPINPMLIKVDGVVPPEVRRILEME